MLFKTLQVLSLFARPSICLSGNFYVVRDYSEAFNGIFSSKFFTLSKDVNLGWITWTVLNITVNAKS